MRLTRTSTSVEAELVTERPRDLQDVADELGALGGDDLLDRALGDDALEAVLDDLGETARGRLLVAVVAR